MSGVLSVVSPQKRKNSQDDRSPKDEPASNGTIVESIPSEKVICQIEHNELTVMEEAKCLQVSER